MKKVVFLAVAFASCIFVANATSVITTAPVMKSASSSDTPPPAVLSSFKSIFGNVPVKQWKLRSEGTWRAHFSRNGVAWEATFTSNGQLVKSERN